MKKNHFNRDFELNDFLSFFLYTDLLSQSQFEFLKKTKCFWYTGRSSGQQPVCSHSCWMYVRAGRPAFARPCVGIYIYIYIYIYILHAAFLCNCHLVSSPVCVCVCVCVCVYVCVSYAHKFKHLSISQIKECSAPRNWLLTSYHKITGFLKNTFNMKRLFYLLKHVYPLVRIKIISLPISNGNYVTTNVTISLVIYTAHPMILFSFKSQLFRKLFYVIITVGLTSGLITCNCLYVYNQTQPSSVCHARCKQISKQ